jgi:hypothetical protein
VIYIEPTEAGYVSLMSPPSLSRQNKAKVIEVTKFPPIHKYHYFIHASTYVQLRGVVRKLQALEHELEVNVKPIFNPPNTPPISEDLDLGDTTMHSAIDFSPPLSKTTNNLHAVCPPRARSGHKRDFHHVLTSYNG